MTRAAIVVMALCSLVALPAHAQGPSAVTSREAFDGRPDEPTRTEDDVGRWAARVLLAPIWLVLLSGQEVTRLILEPIHDESSSIDAQEPEPGVVTLLPSVQLETDRSFAGGLYLELALDPVTLRLRGLHFDDRRLLAALDARLEASELLQLQLEAELGLRGDRRFFGLGWRSPNEDRQPYRHLRGGSILRAILRPEPKVRASLETRVTHHQLDRPQAPSRESEWTVLATRATLRLDSRARRVAAAPGAALGVELELAGTPDRGARWVRVGVRFAVTVALSPEHDLTLGGRALIVEPFGDAPPPFMELATLGGTRAGDLAGFPRWRLVGWTAAVVHLRYRWALHQGFDAVAFLEAGNTFGRGLRDIRAERARLSAGLAIESVASDAHRVGLGAALGSSPLVDGLGVDGGHLWVYLGTPP